MAKSARSRKPFNRDVFLKDPAVSRPGEKVGGGYFVMRRGAGGRVKPSAFPFEHATQEEAEAIACDLSAQHPGVFFDVVGVLSTAITSSRFASANSAEIAA